MSARPGSSRHVSMLSDGRSSRCVATTSTPRRARGVGSDIRALIAITTGGRLGVEASAMGCRLRHCARKSHVVPCSEPRLLSEETGIRPALGANLDPVPPGFDDRCMDGPADKPLEIVDGPPDRHRTAAQLTWLPPQP